jgi:hypothetical protein
MTQITQTEAIASGYCLGSVRDLHHRCNLWLSFFVAIAAAAAPASSRGSDGAAPSLRIPNAPARRGDGRTVRIETTPGGGTLAKVHAEVGDYLVVIRPDGELLSLPAAQTKYTDAEFKPATKDEIISGLADGSLKGFKTRQTNRFLYLYNTSEEFYTATSRILETMYPGVFEFFKRQRIEVVDPPTPLVVIMFRTVQEFQRYREMPPGVAAYYDQVTNRVVMYETSGLNQVAPGLAIKQSISTIAHEGTHQILHNIGVQQRLSRWPMWISEGIAEYFSPTSVERRVRWKGVAQVNDLRMFELERYLKQAAGDAAKGETVRVTVAAESLTSTGYASAWALTHYLAQRQKAKFLDYLNDISRTGPLEDRSTESEAIFVKHFGNEFATIEQAMIKHLQGLPYTRPELPKAAR